MLIQGGWILGKPSGKPMIRQISQKDSHAKVIFQTCFLKVKFINKVNE